MAQEKVRFQTDWLASGEHAAYYGGALSRASLRRVPAHPLKRIP